MSEDRADPADEQPVVLLTYRGCAVTLDHRDTEVAVSLAGEIDLDNADQVLAVLRPLIEEAPSSIAVDLGALQFIDSFGISRLIIAQQSAIDFGVSLSLRNPRPETHRVFVVAGLTDYLRIDGPAAAS